MSRRKNQPAPESGAQQVPVKSKASTAPGHMHCQANGELPARSEASRSDAFLECDGDDLMRLSEVFGKRFQARANAEEVSRFLKGEIPMSESREHKRRYNQRLQYIAEFEKWLNREPPIWKVFSWRKWKSERPIWQEVQ